MASLVSIIVPVYNEEQTVLPLLERLLQVEMPADREVLVVNDGSTDGTRDGLDTLGWRSGLRVLHAVRNGGKGSAIRLGLSQAAGDVIAIQDADLELDPADLPRLVHPILRGESVVVYGSRFLGGRPAAPWLTIAANRLLTGVTNALFGSAITDMETCYKIMRADVARSLNLRSDRFDIEPEITAKLLLAGHRIDEQPVSFNPRSRAAGKKINWRDGVRALQVLFQHRFGRADTSLVANPEFVEASDTSAPAKR
ncbi:MAG TPA: glycosyltransferase family 2 protein [Vicinamibacterales bacterium]|nr:glycosyltransferase family 2 protein [Vicinamibacterales bacterium]